MKKRTLKKARIQLQICIPLLCIGILAAGVLIVKNLSWAEISMAAVGILIGIYGLYGILDAGNFCIAYDDEEIMVRDFRRKTKKFYYQDLEGFCFQNNFEEVILYFKNGRIVLDDATEGKERFVKVAERKYTKYHCGQIQSFLSCLPFGVCAWHVWGSPVYFRREKKQNFMDRFMWSHSSNTLKT